MSILRYVRCLFLRICWIQMVLRRIEVP